MESKMTKIDGNGRNIPEEIIEKILINLPVKSIIRFQAVHKSWFHLIQGIPNSIYNNRIFDSDSNFLAVFSLNYSKSSLKVFLYHHDHDGGDGGEEDDDDDKLKKFSEGLIGWRTGQKTDPDGCMLSPVFKFKLRRRCTVSSALTLVGHCNGVICFKNRKVILLVNPILKEVRTVDLPKGPRIMFVCVGFDKTRNDFRLVLLSTYEMNGKTRAQVYSLRSNSWRELDAIRYLLSFSSRNVFVVFEGVIYTFVYVREFCAARMLTFNLVDESFDLLEFPQEWYDSYRKTSNHALYVLNQESLVFVSFPRPEYTYAGTLVNVWTMNKHDKNEITWTKLFSIDLVGWVLPIGFLTKYKFLYYNSTGELILHDLLNHRRIVVWNDKQIPRYSVRRMIQVSICGSSLVSMNNV